MNAKNTLCIAAGMLVAITCTSMASNQSANARRNIASYIVPPASHYAGKSYAEWLQAAEVRHWSIPSTGIAPNFGSPEYDADPQQLQGGPVFFLDFSWNLDPFNPIPDVRHATVPKGTAILADIDGFYSFRHDTEWLWNLMNLFTYSETLIIDGVEIPFDGSLSSPYWIRTESELTIPENSASHQMGAGGVVGAQPFYHIELIAILKPLPPGEHIIEIKGGNTGNAMTPPDKDIWWNWEVWHITVTE